MTKLAHYLLITVCVAGLAGMPALADEDTGQSSGNAEIQQDPTPDPQSEEQTDPSDWQERCPYEDKAEKPLTG